ncbi:uncharacterized protein A4U43_UnF6660 [Asparagus officinalis]|uniref:Uncharacterized protein n=1 Tax=Asparagus officinalis TaxID=4686 RepID=A0A1R3L6D6_ASPOF|nr:uncharacterized protein A4U43_UnF6660 [Asparagus officinalis]
MKLRLARSQSPLILLYLKNLKAAGNFFVELEFASQMEEESKGIFFEQTLSSSYGPSAAPSWRMAKLVLFTLHKQFLAYQRALIMTANKLLKKQAYQIRCSLWRGIEE